MSSVLVPNLPQRPVSLVIMDGRIPKEIEESLNNKGLKVIKTHEYKGLYEAVSYHPDIMLHHIGGENIVYAPHINEALLIEIRAQGFNLISGETKLSYKYPYNIAYNVARVGNKVLHNFKYTDKVLLNELDSIGVEFINVNQGYAKCSISVVNDNCIITEDKGIAKKAEKKGIEVLLIDPEEKIGLKGQKHGFIGGSSGLVDKNTWAITGQLDTLKAASKIRDFLSSKGMNIISLSSGQIIDLGSFITIKTY